MARVMLSAVVPVIAAVVVLQPAGAVATEEKEKHVLVVLATSGARPYSVTEVERTMRKADVFLRTASLGEVRLHVDVTPWLAAFTGDPAAAPRTAASKASLSLPDSRPTAPDMTRRATTV